MRDVNDTVTKISGTLGAIVSYKKIKTFKVEASPLLEYFPRGLENFFPNLETLVITQTGLKYFTADDIKVFPNLTSLFLNGNQLEEIYAKTFEFNEKLETIDLSANKLSNVGFNFFKFLKNLKSINLSNNVCINERAQNSDELKKVKIILNENCLKRISNYGLYFSIFLLLLATLFFVVLLFTCFKWIIN